MLGVGVRELRQRASELLRLVARGETIEVTDRGRPVAILAPVPGGSPLERLWAAGEITAQQLGEDLAQLVTYDARLKTAAEALGLKVAAPS